MLDFAHRVVWIPVVNASGETIPGGALMEPFADPPTHNGQDEDGNTYVRKPTFDGNPEVIVNGEAEIPDGETGQGHYESVAVLRYDTEEYLPIAGDRFGSKADSWQAHLDTHNTDYNGGGGFKILYAGNGRAVARRDHSVRVVSGFGAMIEYGQGSDLNINGILVRERIVAQPGSSVNVWFSVQATLTAIAGTASFGVEVWAYDYDAATDVQLTGTAQHPIGSLTAAAGTITLSCSISFPFQRDTTGYAGALGFYLKFVQISGSGVGTRLDRYLAIIQ